MKVSQALRPLVVALCLSVGTTCAAASSQQVAEQYKPQVGQEGKDVVWVPTPDAVVEKMLDLGNVTPNDFLIDLGSGDGRTVITAAKRGARAMGIEYNPDMVALSKRNAAAAKVADKATFVQGDLYESDFSKATVITMFLLPQINLKLRPALLQLRPGTRLVSNTFTMGDWKADETATVEGDCTSYCTALLWIVPARADGTWRMPGGQLVLKQEFQMLSGTLTIDGRETPISNGMMKGAAISFAAGNAEYTGVVGGTAIEGTVSAGGSRKPWRATR